VLHAREDESAARAQAAGALGAEELDLEAFAHAARRQRGRIAGADEGGDASAECGVGGLRRRGGQTRHRDEGLSRGRSLERRNVVMRRQRTLHGLL
jgi:hypothetical protein